MAIYIDGELWKVRGLLPDEQIPGCLGNLPGNVLEFFWTDEKKTLKSFQGDTTYPVAKTVEGKTRPGSILPAAFRPVLVPMKEGSHFPTDILDYLPDGKTIRLGGLSYGPVSIRVKQGGKPVKTPAAESIRLLAEGQCGEECSFHFTDTPEDADFALEFIKQGKALICATNLVSGLS